MNEKHFQSRLQQLNDTESEWNKVASFVPKSGEFIIYNTDDEHSHPRVKIGDGVTPLQSLPFLYPYRKIAADTNGVDTVFLLLTGFDGVTADEDAGIVIIS